jgi:hypothetical protein
MRATKPLMADTVSADADPVSDYSGSQLQGMIDHPREQVIERTHGSDDVDIPVSPELQAACNAMPKAHLTYIVNAQGKPRSKYGLGNDFAKWATQAGLPKRCRLQGLRFPLPAPAEQT